MNLFTLFYCFFFIVQNVISHGRFKRGANEDFGYEIEVIGASSIFTCDGHCIAKIENFTITEQTNKCHFKYLEMKIDRRKNCKTISASDEIFFLTPEKGCLVKNQREMRHCPRIKRFFEKFYDF